MLEMKLCVDFDPFTPKAIKRLKIYVMCMFCKLER